MLFPLLHHVIAHFVSPVLLYHSILPDSLNEMGNTIHNVDPEIFEQQILWIKKHYEIITIDKFFALKNRKGKACITFDDAYRSVFDHAVPLLIKHQLPATIFINTATVEGKIFWRDKIRFIITQNLTEAFLAYRLQNWPTSKPLEAINFYRASKANTINSQEIETQINSFITAHKLETKIKALSDYIATPQDLIANPLITYGNHSLDHYVMSSLTDPEQGYQISENKHQLNNYNVPLSNIFSVPFGGEKDMNAHTKTTIKKYGYDGYLYSRNRMNKNTHLLGFQVERIMPDNTMKLFHKRFAGAILRSLKKNE